MQKILIYYYTRSGNTEKMAKAIMEGMKSVKQTEVKMKYYVSPDELTNFDAIVIGVPTYHGNMASDIKNLLNQLPEKQINLKNKIGATFGSYGWSGEAPGKALDIMKNKLSMKVIEPPLRIKKTPDQKGLKDCKEFGKKIAATVLK